MVNSRYVLTNPIGWGPFIVEHVVPGESVMFVRNENYVWGAPYVERVVLERVAPELAGTAMATGRYDIMLRFGTAFYEDYANSTNFQFIGVLDHGYLYMSFRLGHFDFDNNVNVYSPNRTMSNPALRRAMALALDQAAISEILFHGLQFPATSIMTPNFTGLMDLSVPPIIYNPALANQLLDEAGFTTRDAAGYRNHPDGSPLTVIWAEATGPLEDIMVPLYINFWREIGVRVELWRGQTHAIGYLWDVLDYDADNDEIDLYMARWTSINNPDPTGRWGHAIWNPSRYNSPELEAIFDGLFVAENWDEDNLRAAYSKWQWYVYEQAFYLPKRWTIALTLLNNRIANFDARVHTPASQFNWHSIRLSAPEPIR
jgi:peptide/nickel transport system substrate-binding protein